MAKSQEEIDEFLNMNNISFENIDTSQSYKTNIFIIRRNFKKLTDYLGVTLSFIKDLYSRINVETLIREILNDIESQKTVINVDTTLVTDTSITQKINERIYRILRVNNYQVKITLDNATLPWNVDNLIICIKDFNGIIVYPTISTKDSEINIYFNDIISSNYKVIIL